MVKDCASFRGDDGSHLQHICFDNSTEYDPEVAFDKHLFSQPFAPNVAFYET